MLREFVVHFAKAVGSLPQLKRSHFCHPLNIKDAFVELGTTLRDVLARNAEKADAQSGATSLSFLFIPLAGSSRLVLYHYLPFNKSEAFSTSRLDATVAGNTLEILFRNPEFDIGTIRVNNEMLGRFNVQTSSPSHAHESAGGDQKLIRRVVRILQTLRTLINDGQRYEHFVAPAELIPRSQELTSRQFPFPLQSWIDNCARPDFPTKKLQATLGEILNGLQAART